MPTGALPRVSVKQSTDLKEVATLEIDSIYPSPWLSIAEKFRESIFMLTYTDPVRHFLSSKLGILIHFVLSGREVP